MTVCVVSVISDVEGRRPFYFDLSPNGVNLKIRTCGYVRPSGVEECSLRAG